MSYDTESRLRDAIVDVLEGIIVSAVLGIFTLITNVPSNYVAIFQLLEIMFLIGGMLVILVMEKWKLGYLLGWLIGMSIMSSLGLIESWLFILYAVVGLLTLFLNVLLKAGMRALYSFFIFLALALLEFVHFVVVGWSDNMVYPVLDMGTTSVWMEVSKYLNGWFFLFEFPFVIASAVLCFVMGSRIKTKGWKVTVGYTALALTVLGICLYVVLDLLTYNWMYQLVPNIILIMSPSNPDMHTFIRAAIGNGTVLSRYFWTAFQFVVSAGIVGFVGSQIVRERH